MRLLAVLILVGASASSAAPHDVALTAAFQIDSFALPWTHRFDEPIRPGARLGAEWVWLGEQHQLIQSVALGYSSALPVQRLGLLVTEAGYRWTAPIGLQLEAMAVVGAGLEFAGAPTYVPRDGSLVAGAAPPRLQLLAGASLGAGFRFARWPLDVFVRYQPLFQLPYAPTVPALPHVTLLAGVRWRL